MNEKRPFVTTGEIVRIAKVHPNTVAMWRLSQKIVPKDKVGASYLYDRKDVEKFLKEREEKKRGRKSKA